MKTRVFLIATCVSVVSLLSDPSAQPIPVSYTVRLASATVYDTRSRDEDTVHAALAAFVKGELKGTSLWDGKGWDGSRTEGRRWVTGLHLFGAPDANTVHVSTGRLQDTDTVHIVFALSNAATSPPPATEDAVLRRIEQSRCNGGDTVSGWDCLAPQAGEILAVPAAGCDGLLAADKLVYAAMQLRRRTETGDTVTVNNVYRGSPAPAACGSSIYGVVLTIARD